jgi:hypothetical protein
MGNLAKLYNVMADARVELGRAEDYLEHCPPEEKRDARHDVERAQEALTKAKEDLNLALVQLGRQPQVSDRPARLVNF